LLNEADTCTRFVLTKLRSSGWDEGLHSFNELYPDYVARVTSDEGDIGKTHLSNFQGLERATPVILTTSQLLTTGVDAPTCKIVVLARVINSMTEFKQIIGRGTRFREDAGKLWFSILDYTGSATRLFADPEFDGDPVSDDSIVIDDDGAVVPDPTSDDPPNDGDDDEGATVIVDPIDPVTPPCDPGARRKFYFDGGSIEIVHHYVSELDADGKQLRVVKFTDYTKDKVRTLYTSADDLRGKWADPQQRRAIIEQLEEVGINFDELAAAANQPEADPFDLFCHIAFNAPLKTRRERAARLRSEKQNLFDRFGPQAREVLMLLLTKYEQHGTAQFVLPDVLQITPISLFGNVIEIAGMFGGVDELRSAVEEIQTGLYAAQL
jgi:type I restriction enzyme R subunit